MRTKTGRLILTRKSWSISNEPYRSEFIREIIIPVIQRNNYNYNTHTLFSSTTVYEISPHKIGKLRCCNSGANNYKHIREILSVAPGFINDLDYKGRSANVFDLFVNLINYTLSNLYIDLHNGYLSEPIFLTNISNKLSRQYR